MAFLKTAPRLQKAQGADFHAALWAPQEPGKDEIVYTAESKFKFDCHPALSCFNQCCREINIFLTPYDVLRMKNNLQLPAGEFLQKYTVAVLAENTGLPVVLLKMDEETGRCPFVTEKGCRVYPDRPWSCRMYPLNQDENGNYTLAEGYVRCFGLDEDREWAVREWLADQGLEAYNEVEALFGKVGEQLKSSGHKIQNSKIQDMYYTSCYDLDKFKRFIFESSFLKVFEVDGQTIEKIKSDELELLKFAFQWVLFGVADNKTFKIKDDVLEAKRKALGKKG